MMKTRLLVTVCLLSITFSIKAQFITIPDTAFVNWLNAYGFSQCMNGNQMDTTCNKVVNTTELDLSYNTNLKDITGIEYFDNLDTLKVDGCRITICSKLPLSVTYISISDNLLTSFNSLPPHLRFLEFRRNYVSNLPPLPLSLKTLRCYQNPLYNLPLLPDSLVELSCDSTNITSLPNTLPSHLWKLSCANNPLTSLPNMPASLRELYAQNLQITTVPVLPTALEVLHLSGNSLGTLPLLPDSLIAFGCVSCSLTSLPQLPQKLQALSVKFNYLTILPTIPNTVIGLHISYNNISSIPALPDSMDWLDIDHNDVTHITNLPKDVYYLDISSNPNLVCLPRLARGRLGTTYDSIGITCIPNKVYNHPMNNQYPVCNLFNSTCPLVSNINGVVSVTSTANCSTNGPPLKNIKVNLWKGNNLVQQTLTDVDGAYGFIIDTLGIYKTTIDTVGLPFVLDCPSANAIFDTLSATNNYTTSGHFYLYKRSFDLAAISVANEGVFRPANYTTVSIHAGDVAQYYNVSNTQSVSGTVSVKLHGPIIYVASIGGLNPGSISNNIVTWNISDFGTINYSSDFKIVVQTDTFAQSGEQACFEVNVTPLSGDYDTANNHLYHCVSLVNSYDPNDKTAYPSGNIDTTQEWLTYTVRFQNTGTAEAQHIYIMDTLDTNVKEETFQLLSYSHQPNVQIKENIVRFNFPFINLPDSTSDEPGSHGYIQYKVKLKDDLAIGTAINNTAYIYFDFNPPVVTNTATNTIAVEEDTVVGIRSISKTFDLLVYPNPANQQVTVTTSEAGQAIAIYNTQGKLISTQTMQGNAETINIATLPSGVYYIEVSGKNIIARKKFVKL